MVTNRRIRIISIIIISYMIVALAWWTLLLHKKNNDVLRYQKAIINKESISLPSLEQIEQKHQRQLYMIFGEGLVFALSLITGIYIINKAAQKEFKVAQLKNNFLLSVTHELKSPISSIKMVLQTLANNLHLEESKRTEVIHNALQDTNRLESMTNKLLLSTRLEDQYQYNFEDVHLKYFFSFIISNYPYQKGIKHISLDCPPNLSAEIDQEAIKSVLTNLIENALKYSLKDEAIKIKVTEEADRIGLACIDNGPGIVNAEKKAVLEKFYRIGNEEYRSTDGSGLGLFIVNQIVRAHSGTLSILDNKPKGTIIKILLPKYQNTK